MTNEREKILSHLAAFIKQRPGLEFGNYGDLSTYRSEMRAITKDRHDAEALLAAVAWRESITADDLKAAFRAFSGRLSWDGQRLSYCTGQYFPTEYRRAVCAVLAQALWDYTRDRAMPEPDGFRVHFSDGTISHLMSKDAAAEFLASRSGKGERGDGYLQESYGGKTAGDWLRGYFRREFGARISRRWFD